jgi:signal peptidase I
MTDTSKSNLSKKATKKAAKHEETWGEFFKTVFFAFLIAISFRTLVLQPFSIPSESMLKNLMVGDFLLVSKFSYGFTKHSLPFSLPLISGRIFASDIERGDVVVFRLPRDPDTYYIKRIIGRPGDKIQTMNGELYLNDVKVPRKRLDDYVRLDGYGYEERFQRYQETLPNGKSYVTLDKGVFQNRADNSDVFIVPQGHYFAMGDNRDNSMDSRWPKNIGVGYVPDINIIGKAKWITASFDNNSALWQFWKWFPAERRERFFSSIN